MNIPSVLERPARVVLHKVRRLLLLLGVALRNPGAHRTGAYEGLLARSTWDLPRLAAVMRERHRPIEDGYWTAHDRRFLELVQFVEVTGRTGTITSMIEVGPNQYTTFVLTDLVPGDATLATVDRPADQGGWFDQLIAASQSSTHVEVDFNASAVADRVRAAGVDQVDLILCTEVVEHLLADPTEIIGDLLELLRPGGLLYLTTPNFTSGEKLEALLAGWNPMIRFDRSAGNVDAHYHLREYTMHELTTAAEWVGASVELAAFSRCWDDGDASLLGKAMPSLRSNLVLVLGKPGGGSDSPAGALQAALQG